MGNGPAQLTATLIYTFPLIPVNVSVHELARLVDCRSLLEGGFNAAGSKR
jgi:hypothetical protein